MPLALVLLPAVLQMLAMAFDELVFHRRRGLPRWERIGHPLDTATAALCYGWLVWVTPQSPHALAVYIALCAFSSVFITKDELVHARLCAPAEMWLHSLLFVLHPIVFLAFGLVWWGHTELWLLKLELILTLGLLAHQLVYWSLLWQPTPNQSRS